MANRSACDQPIRDLVAGDLTTTFLVEASAGTGKTKLLVDRYIACVLDPERGAGDVRTVAAITFTEKAAGELRQRIRERFEQLAEEARPLPHAGAADATAADEGAAGEGADAGRETATAVARALDTLDDAPISTIHGFAGRLLREYSVEAGVDPAFEQLDQLGGELERGRLWDQWLTELAAGDGADDELGRVRGWVALLLEAGVRLATLRDLAVGKSGVFAERYDVDPAPEPPPPPDFAEGVRGLADAVRGLRDVCAVSCRDEEDLGYKAAMDLLERLTECESEICRQECGLDAQAAAVLALPLKTGKSGPGGNQKNWGGKDGKAEFVACYACLAEGVLALRDAYAAHVAGLALAVVDAFTRWAGATQLSLGRLDFTDLLGQLRDLLANDKATRGELQRRFRYILVDEFQDTDPLQAELVMLLCEREPQASDWREVVLKPGKLFVVGDPKQSIYRFRRADIALYDEVKQIIEAQPQGEGRVLAIEQNFRTTPSLVEWVNNVFADVFEADEAPGRQPGYQWAVPYRPPAEGPRVSVVLGEERGRAAGEADDQRRDEARALAALLRQMHEDGAGHWSVCERRTSPDGREEVRPAAWGDIAVLVRATTGLETYEQAFRDAGVPYRVEGGGTYFARREVDDALLCLRAVDDPSDGPAVYGALHSSLFGFSDDELFVYWAAGGRFDVFAEAAAGRGQPAGHGAIVAALAVLRRLHERRAASEAYELVEELLRATRSEELQAATGDGAPQALANLEKLVERARAFSAAGGGGLGAFLRWAAEAGDTAGEQESHVDDESDVVRVLTIHKAKGLEFPIVVLAGGTLGGSGGGGGPLVDRRARRLAVRLKADLPGATCELVPKAYADLAEREKEMAASEARRLLYVAATRARDRLVVGVFGPMKTQKGEPAAVLLGPLHACLPAPGTITESGERDGLLVLMPGEAPPRSRAGAPAELGALLAERASWAGERARLLERARVPVAATSPSALERFDEEVRAGGPGAPPGRAGALALGSIVHRAMELCDFADEASVAVRADEAAAELGRPDLAEPAAALAGACWRAAPVRAAARSPEVYRELPVGVLVEGTIVSGAVDLLYRDGAEWVIVDYKTDRAADEEALRARYTPQGAAYALAVEAATGGVVREVAFVAAAAGLVVGVPVTDELRRAARADVARAVGAGRLSADDVVE